MAIVRGRANTAGGSKHLQRLCKQWSHRFEVEFSKDQTTASLPIRRRVTEASEDALLVFIETDDTNSIGRLKEIVASHLDRFAFRDAPLPFG